MSQEIVTFKMYVHFQKKTPKPRTTTRACTSLQQCFQPSMTSPSQPAVLLLCGDAWPWEPARAGWHQSLLLESPQKGPAGATRSGFAPLPPPPSLEHRTQENPSQPTPNLPANSTTTPSIFNGRSAPQIPFCLCNWKAFWLHVSNKFLCLSFESSFKGIAQLSSKN